MTADRLRIASSVKLLAISSCRLSSYHPAIVAHYRSWTNSDNLHPLLFRVLICVQVATD